jgi:aldose 1-epimerase
MTHFEHPIVWLTHAGQRLGLVPSLGGGVAAWQLERRPDLLDLWRPWDGRNPDMYSLASFAMVPWSNRISKGGFDHDGQFYPMVCNRLGEPYPIHGDGWLQPWTLKQPADDTLVMSLQSHQFAGNPYEYEATQTFRLVQGGLDQTVRVTHTGFDPLPYGLGLHPWFLRTQRAWLHADVQGVWLSGADPLPLMHTTDFPPGWDLGNGVDVNGTLVDNAFTGWSGESVIRWPEDRLQLTMRVPAVQQAAQVTGAASGYCLLYRPPGGPAFCFEPVTHPIDSFHAPDRAGLKVLNTGETLTLHVEWRFQTLV